MKKNVGGLDRIFRVSVGFASLAIAFAAGDVLLRLIFALVAVIGIGTGLLGYCPISDKLGIDTAAKKSK